MKIGIDARLYGTKHSGIGRYTAEIIKNLEKLDQKNDYYVFLSHDGMTDYQPQNPKFKKISADFKVYGWQEQLLFPFMLADYQLDLMYFTHFNVPIFYPKKFIVTIHDLIISHYPQSRATTLNPFLYRVKLFFYRWVVQSAAKRAKKIIAVSNYTKNDIVRLLGVKPEKISVIYEGVDLPGRVAPLGAPLCGISQGEPSTGAPDCQKVLQDLGIGGNFIIYAGSAYPHKNLERLISAFEKINQALPDLLLVLVGKNNYFYERLKSYADNSVSAATRKKIIFTDYLTDDRLVCLYQSARAYVFPSLIEGFGLPPLEAQNYGASVISSNKTCLPEILGDSAVYFDPENIQDMADKIISTLNDENLKQRLINQGRENLKKYSWSKAAQEILELFQ